MAELMDELAALVGYTWLIFSAFVCLGWAWERALQMFMRNITHSNDLRKFLIAYMKAKGDPDGIFMGQGP